jgi:LysR family nitrogen assimilation transcriptional regulator
VLDEPLCLVAPLASDTLPRGPLAMLRLAGLPLVMPERSHVIRRLVETQAALIGLKLDIAWEVSSIAAIIDLVCAGYGHAVLTGSAVIASGRADQLAVHPLTQPPLTSVLCLAVSSHKRPSPLMRHTIRLLTELARSLPQGAAAQSQPG